MREERGFTPSTLEQWTRVIGRFLRWCDQTNRQLGDLQAADIAANMRCTSDQFGAYGNDSWR
ncbi:hypothetical protein [Sinorhizobium medicae]|uniref:hypothetical protein n=1 Tax=Sinorhizobium medicae TaxID=110321 RepID=UPI001F1BA779|nr:hypothetical protein [Sinorhizobium medicae]